MGLRRIKYTGMIRILPLLCGLLSSLSVFEAMAQSIQLDHPVLCGQLQCFPSSNNPNHYFYLPSRPRLAVKEDGKPEFSFIRYADAGAATESGGGISETGGGGIVHFLVDYRVEDKTRIAAEKALQEINEDAILKGPIIFEQGRFALVSSFLPDEENRSELSRAVVGMGNAPLIEGLKSAVSLHLTKRGAQLLWQSFQMETPDISLVFEMQFSGLHDPAEAKIIAHWEKLRKQVDNNLGVKIGYAGIGLGFDYKKFWDDARQTGAIQIDYKGDPKRLQSIIDRAYSRLHDLMFEPIKIEESSHKPDKEMGEMMQAINAGKGQNAGYSYPWEAKVSGGYKRRKISRKGRFELDFRERSQARIVTPMAGNIGELYRRYGNDDTIFQTVSLSDNVYRVREVPVTLDARDADDFGRYVNHVTVHLRKHHGSGKVTEPELTVNRKNVSSGRPLILRYPWDKESSITAWTEYEYRLNWSFVGGSQFTSPWIKSSNAALTLTPPYQYRRMEFIASPKIFNQRNVRLATVRLWHEFFGQKKRETIRLLPGNSEYTAVREFAIPPDKETIDYEITWTFKNGRKISSGKITTDEEVVFCDEIPN